MTNLWSLYNSKLVQDRAIVTTEQRAHQYKSYHDLSIGAIFIWPIDLAISPNPIFEKSSRICLAVYTEYWRVADGRTDGQTDFWQIMYAFNS